MTTLLELTLDYPNIINDRYIAVQIDSLYLKYQNEMECKFNEYEKTLFVEAVTLYVKGHLNKLKLPLFPPEKDNQNLIDNIK